MGRLLEAATRLQERRKLLFVMDKFEDIEPRERI